MRRDMDLIRRMLIEAEESDEPIRDARLKFMAGDDQRKALYHVELLQGYGLVNATIRRTTGADLAVFSIDGLTWEGCDYLDAIRSDTVWRKVRDAVTRTLGDVPLMVTKNVCTSLATKMAMNELGLS